MKFAQIRFVVAAAMVATAACGGAGSVGGLEAEQTYLLDLLPQNEVPLPKATTASGLAQIIVLPASIEFKLSGTSITGITMAHIHNGAPGVAGPVVVTLFLPGSPTGAISGIFASGALNASNLPGGVTLESLKALLLSGNAYVNVHTTANPTGEIRGQVK